MKYIRRRKFLKSAVVPFAVPFAAPLATTSFLWLGADAGQGTAPNVRVPAGARGRIAVASYPFREFILGKSDSAPGSPAKMPLKGFAAHVVARFDIRKIEPWSEHFLSMELGYLEELRNAVSMAGVTFANIAADGVESLYSEQAGEREGASHFYKRWINVAATVGSPSVRTNISAARGGKPDAGGLAEKLKPLAEYAAARNIVVHLENDNPVSENPFFLVELLDRVNSPWLRALPDFGNSLAALPAEEAYRGLDLMFTRSYGISHVKNPIMENGKTVPVDLARVFAIAAKRNYKGYFSMEWDTEGDVYAGTEKLIAETLKNIS